MNIIIVKMLAELEECDDKTLDVYRPEIDVSIAMRLKEIELPERKLKK